MADNIFSIVCSCALKHVGAEGVDQVIAWFGQHLSDQGQRLTTALKESNEKAWKALEIALAGETLWNKLDRAEDRAFRQQLAGYLKQLSLPELEGKQPFRKKCLQDLFDAKKKALLIGRLVPEELARRAGTMANRSDPQGVLAAEKKALNDLAAEFKKAKLESMAWLLEQQPQPGQSILVVAVRYYFQRQVEEDAELARRLQFTAMETLTEAQGKGFRELEAGLKAYAGRVEEVMADLAEVAGEIRDLAGQIRDSTLDLRSEMENMHGESKEFYGRVLQMLEQQQMHQRPVHPGDSLSLRTDQERHRVKEFLARYRQMPEEDKRAAPALLNGLGKLQVATGDYQSAQEAFTRVAEISPDARSRAEGHFNAYRAALEHAAAGDGSYQVALAELRLALRFDPARFAPFPPDEYEPQRILGAGGFGVTFLCKKKLTGTDVAVKALQAEGLERDMSSVMQEASTLDQIAHPAIIRLRHCGYADAARTRPFIEMDYFESMTLEEYVRKNGRLSVADLLAVARPLAEALLAAHGKGILHRDVKPANLLVRRTGARWEVRVIDFGLALKQSLLEVDASSSRRNRSMTGADIAGTRHYAAPEQMGELPGVRVGPRADIYGFAKTCCYALFQNTEPTLLDYEKAPRALATLLSQCLARSPNDRPSGFDEVLKKLKDFAKPKPAPTPVPQSIPIPIPTPKPALNPIPIPKSPERPKPTKAVEIRSIDELLGEDVPHVLPVTPKKYPEAIPTGLSSRRLPKPPSPQPAPSSVNLVRAPAIALLSVCATSVLLNLIVVVCVGIVISAESASPLSTYPSYYPEQKSDGSYPYSSPYSSPAPIYTHSNDSTKVLALVMYGAFLLVSAVATFGAVLMLWRKVYVFSLISCFLAMAPIGGCFLLGLPVGIWGVVVLLRKDVRSTFT